MLHKSTAHDEAARLQSVHPRHVPVHQDQSIWTLRIGSGYFLDCLLGGRSRFCLQRKSAKRIAQDLRGLLIVINHQDADARQVWDETLPLHYSRSDGRTGRGSPNLAECQLSFQRSILRLPKTSRKIPSSRFPIFDWKPSIPRSGTTFLVDNKDG